MKKAVLIVSLILIISIIFVPIPHSSYDDGGTREYSALAYKIVDWNRISADGTYSETKLYFIPDCYKSIDELWEQEEEKMVKTFAAVIVQINLNTVIVEPIDDSSAAQISDRISFDISKLEKLDACVGDLVKVTYEGPVLDSYPAIINAISWEFGGDEYMCMKPVIYLYPEKETPVTVKLDYKGELTCTYPEYKNGWQVTAMPDGTIIDKNGQEYNYLYWEGKDSTEYDFSQGFCVKGEDTAAFLERALEKQGLTRREANEFIVYWLPQMQDNPYNIISFQTEKYNDTARLDINPAPDTLIRVYMTWYACNVEINIEEQKLSAPTREGFTVVEWGGSQLPALSGTPLK